MYCKLEFEKYARKVPHGKLDLILDEENNGMDIHLREIARSLSDSENWETSFPVALGLTSHERSDILEVDKQFPEKQRCVKCFTVGGQNSSHIT